MISTHLVLFLLLFLLFIFLLPHPDLISSFSSSFTVPMALYYIFFRHISQALFLLHQHAPLLRSLVLLLLPVPLPLVGLFYFSLLLLLLFLLRILFVLILRLLPHAPGLCLLLPPPSPQP